jgi:hypothetical protein
MSDSYPIIQDSLSEMQREFMGCVETHLDPPEAAEPSYRVEALYRVEDESDDGVRFAVMVDESDPDISERRHVIEFVSLAQPQQPLAQVMHSMKRVEASQGVFFWTESQFRVAGPEVPDGTLSQELVEREVKGYLERVKTLDSSRRLVEVVSER